MTKRKKKGLGRGLSALMADMDTTPVTTNPTEEQISPVNGEMMVPIEKVSANPDQPRRDFDPDDLDDLATSIAARGIIQPIIVRTSPNSQGEYQIVAGERRWRAAQMAKLHQIPVILREMDDKELLEIAIIENIQRSDLNAMEEAMGFRALMDSFGHTQEQVSSALGKSRSHIANSLRLMTLPDPVQKLVRDKKLSAGHARTLVGQDNSLNLAKEIIKKGLSVRQAEALVKQGVRKETAQKFKGLTKDADTRAVESDLKAALKMKVDINHKAGSEKGQLTVTYGSLDDLDRLCALLSSNQRAASK